MLKLGGHNETLKHYISETLYNITSKENIVNKCASVFSSQVFAPVQQNVGIKI